MATAVLRSQGCIRDNRFRSETLIYPQSMSRLNPNPNQMRSRRRKRSPVGTQDKINGQSRSKAQNRTVDSRSAAKKLVMGQVKILKRGEMLDPLKSGLGDDFVLSSTDRLGPEPDTVQKQIDGLYAGSPSIFASPPPSSLPIPAFFTKKDKPTDAATIDLRKLLRLDLI